MRLRFPKTKHILRIFLSLKTWPVVSNILKMYYCYDDKCESRIYSAIEGKVKQNLLRYTSYVI